MGRSMVGLIKAWGLQEGVQPGRFSVAGKPTSREAQVSGSKKDPCWLGTEETKLSSRLLFKDHTPSE